MDDVNVIEPDEIDHLGDEPEQVDGRTVLAEDADVEIAWLRLAPPDTAEDREQTDPVPPA